MSDRPIYGRRLVVPSHVRIHSRLVHLVSPLFYAATRSFMGQYATCLGVLDNKLIMPALSDQPIDWESWLVPSDTPLTCLQCVVTDINEWRRR